RSCRATHTAVACLVVLLLYMMRRSSNLWKVLILAAALPVFDCTAKRPSSAATGGGSRRSRPTATTGRHAAQVPRRRVYEDEDDFARSSGSGSSDGGGHDDDDGDDDNSDAWDSYGDDEDDEDDQFPAGGRGGRSRRTPPSPSYSDLDYYSQEEGDQEKEGEREEGGFWSDDDADGGYDNDGYSSDGGVGGDSWDEDDGHDDTPPTPKSRTNRGAGGTSAPPSRRPRPSAWTGDGGSSGRRRPSGRSVPPRGRSGARERSEVARYDQRGRRRAAPPSTRGFAVRMPAVSGAALASALRRQIGTAKEAVGQAGSLAASTSKKLKREVKLAVSGSWESALLKATWPDDLPPDETLVLSMVDAVQAFKKDRDVTKNSAEHRVLLRKLWAKMSEPDWRTVSKAVYLFHCILRDLSTEHHAVLKIFLGKMSREWDKKTGSRYFNLDVLCGVNEEGEAFRSFVDRYGTYVFKRAEGFNARFQELDSMREEEGWEHVVTTLAKAQKAIDLGVSCQPEPEEETELTVLCLRNTATDVHQLWRRFHSALAWVLEEADDGDLFEDVDSALVAECLDEFKNFYTSRYDEVSTFLLDAEELLGIYGLRVPDLSLPAAHAFDATPTGADGIAGDDRRGEEDRSSTSSNEEEEEKEEEEDYSESYDDADDEDDEDEEDDDGDALSDQKKKQEKGADSSSATAAKATATGNSVKKKAAAGAKAATATTTTTANSMKKKTAVGVKASRASVASSGGNSNSNSKSKSKSKSSSSSSRSEGKSGSKSGGVSDPVSKAEAPASSTRPVPVSQRARNSEAGRGGGASGAVESKDACETGGSVEEKNEGLEMAAAKGGGGEEGGRGSGKTEEKKDSS
ncbi:unnamed protein product, partial [Pylaiella littoralis]